MSLPTLPLEVLACVFGYLPMRNLASVSLLSRAWKDLAFPHLYAYVHISRTSHLASLASRVASCGGHSPRSIAAHLKRFRIDNPRPTLPESDAINSQSLAHLELLVPHLAKLKYLEMDIWFAYDVKYLQLFQTHCRSLKGVEFVMTNYWSGVPDRLVPYFNFSHLSHISIALPDKSRFTPPGAIFMPEVQDRDMEYLPSLARLLTTCPELVSLSLSNTYPSPMSVVDIVSSLGSNFVFPSLLVFRIDWIAEECQPVGDNLHWNDFFTPPHRDTHPLRLFFLRHERIEDLGLGWSSGTSYEGQIDANEISLLFPNLKRFKGPAFLCNAITKSDIAQNLEALTMVDTSMDEIDWLDAMGCELRSMPRLRLLGIWAHDFEDILDPPILENFVLAAPKIETLECRSVVVDFAAVLIAISQAPKLRELVVDGPSWVASALDQEYDENPAHGDWVDMISRVAKQCHSLESFKNAAGWIGNSSWRIVRDGRGDYQHVLNVG